MEKIVRKCKSNFDFFSYRVQHFKFFGIKFYEYRFKKTIYRKIIKSLLFFKGFNILITELL